MHDSGIYPSEEARNFHYIVLAHACGHDDAYLPKDPEEDKIQIIAQSFTGENCVVTKSWSMTACTSFGRMLRESVDDPTSVPPHLNSSWHDKATR